MSTTPSKPDANEPLVRVRDLKKHFPLKRKFLSRERKYVKAVDGISFDIMPNQTVGLVGESGCGKTTAGRTLLRLLEPTHGEAIFRDRNIFELDRRELRSLRRYMQIIFQDPFSSLNPRMTVEAIIGDAVQVHGIARGDEMRDMVRSLLERVGLQPQYANRYPHEFSGGQRQRIGIARALALNPDFIVCDEAVSALDVSVQAQVLNLLEELQDEYNLSFLFIAHDLSVVRHLSDRVCVMYLGQIVEAADCDALYEEPLHPYTQALLSAIPHPNPNRTGHRIILEGDVPSPINPPSGCRFHTRCPVAFKACSQIVPRDIEVETGHTVKCHLYDDDIKDIPRRSLERTRDVWRQLLKDTRPGEAVDTARERSLFNRSGHELDPYDDADAPDETPSALPEALRFLPRPVAHKGYACAVRREGADALELSLAGSLVSLRDEKHADADETSIDLSKPVTATLTRSTAGEKKKKPVHRVHLVLVQDDARIALTAPADALGDVSGLDDAPVDAPRIDSADMKVVLAHVRAGLEGSAQQFG